MFACPPLEQWTYAKQRLNFGGIAQDGDAPIPPLPRRGFSFLFSRARKKGKKCQSLSLRVQVPSAQMFSPLSLVALNARAK
jgi:hypothetical protein